MQQTPAPAARTAGPLTDFEAVSVSLNPKRAAYLDDTEVFNRLDTNHVGKLSLEEFKARPMAQKDPARAEEIFKKKDTNNDGSLTLEEFSARLHLGKKKGAE